MVRIGFWSRVVVEQNRAQRGPVYQCSINSSQSNVGLARVMMTKSQSQNYDTSLKCEGGQCLCIGSPIRCRVS